MSTAGGDLRPGERVDLIKKLTERLGKIGYNEMDLTLRQLGFPYSDTWRGTSESYAMHHLERGDDQSLRDLDEYLFGENQPPSHIQGRWTAGTFRLFVSHTSAHRAVVGELKKRLLADFGIEAFVAHDDINPAAEWVDEIEIALDTCHAIAAYITGDFHESLWTDQEIGYCLKRRVLVVPIRVEANPYGFFARFQALPGSNLTVEQTAAGIFDILIDNDLTTATMASALVTFFAGSRTYEQARRISHLLDRVKVWTPDSLRAVEEAVAQNDQIQDAWGVPEKIRRLVEARRR